MIDLVMSRKWLAAMRAKREGEREQALKLTRECTAGFVGICDLPGLAVIEEMLEIYPDVKVVLITRDPE